MCNPQKITEEKYFDPNKVDSKIFNRKTVDKIYSIQN